jgi:hypothetical protein
MDDSLLTKLDDDRWLLLGNDLMEPILSASLRVVIAERDALREENGRLRGELERTERMWSEDRAAVKDWAAASDAIGELYEILAIPYDSAGFEDGFKKIVAELRRRAKG